MLVDKNINTEWPYDMLITMKTGRKFEMLTGVIMLVTWAAYIS